MSIQTLARLDAAATLGSNRVNRLPWGRLFAWVSRLGDGWFWYALGFALLAASGMEAVPAVSLMVAGGLLGSLLYKLLKHGIRRQRPSAVAPGLVLTVAPLDRFSFPSGHTLHAVLFSVIATAHAGWLGWIVWPFTVLVAASRLVLGLHYLSDVLAGAAIGAALGWSALAAAAAAGLTI
ncbi:MAG: phosphatase PAP2 family protein [Planctomycetota bacterium]|nr:phosphatase PAP2 family protein [Planctomycetota bacterium]MCX8039851.1 phosphatase PAP2 family protein [Planctomycetota bacterium]MDW8372818.1 phosphatase PAP2 family protein [Planctomycetota bacterium]